ncbi:MAG: sensor histidine kinase [Tissierellales bacterium]|nr:sensor histidine kinase [Tissierellales bacterium]
MIILIIRNLLSCIGIIMLLSFLMTRNKYLRNIITKNEKSFKEKIILILIFSIYGIIGTYTGIQINGAIANSRVIGVFVGGLLGGPFVGAISGLIAGLHRIAIDINGFTAFACAISTFTEGILAGLLKNRFDKSENKIAFALVFGMIAEVIQMIIILIFARPFSEALELVRIISLPMIITNGIGISLSISLIHSSITEIDSREAYQAQLALKIADKTFPYMRKGLTAETAKTVAEIIYSMTNFDAVSITDQNKILAHVGVGEEHHKENQGIMTGLTKRVLRSGEKHFALEREMINCSNKNCKLNSAIVVPLKYGNKIVGALKLYKKSKLSISKTEEALADGLGKLFSTQIELSEFDYQNELLMQSELKALQAQINPHFLFNAINTIAALTRSSPDKARGLLIHLSNYFRNSLTDPNDEVDLQREIENIKSYLEIEKARFGDKLNIVYDIPEGLNCYLPPLIIQPIVENAVKHGIFEKNGNGEIRIEIKNDENDILIYVIDNGVGMDEKTLENIYMSTNNNCIGIRNVNDRLRVKYGEDYKLRLDSKLNCGTTALIKIPKKLKVV